MSSNPFLPPQHAERTSSYRPMRALTVLVVLVLALDAVLLVVNAVSTVMLGSRDPAVLAGSEPRSVSSAFLALIVFLSSALYLLAYIGGGFLFLFWLARANRNARALGADNMKFTPGWMVGWFFVPFLNLFKPYEAVDELYLASDPAPNRVARGGAGTPRFILVWWLSWLLFGIGGSLAHFLGGRMTWALIPNFAGPVAAALAVAVVLSIDRRQAEKRKRLASSVDPPAWSPRRPF